MVENKRGIENLPIYRDNFDFYMEIISILNKLNLNEKEHRLLILEAYKTAIQIFPILNAGYNYWDRNEKIKYYNKVRFLLSKLICELKYIVEFKL